MPTAASLTQKELTRYRERARQHQRREQDLLRRRFERAWCLAHQAAQLLRTHFGVSRVVVFGSLVQSQRFTQWSDVDIAAWGIKEVDTFRAIGAVMDLSNEMTVHLVDVGTCTPSLLASLTTEGIDI